MELVPEELRPQLIANAREHIRVLEESGEHAAMEQAHSFVPVLKLHVEQPRRVWLITELDPRAPDYLYALRDIGDGRPEFAYVSLTSLIAARA